MKIRSICAIALVAGAAAAASADYFVDVRSTVDHFNPLAGETDGMIQVWVKHTGAAGAQNNFGPTKFKGGIDIVGGGAEIMSLGASASPFSAGPTPPTNNGTSLLNVDSFRGPVQGASTPSPYGASDFVLAFEVPIHLTDLTFGHSEIVVSVSGQGQSIVSWNLFLGSWNPRTTGTGITNPLQTAGDEIRIPVLPAPSAMALLGLGGLFAGRRRR